MEKEQKIFLRKSSTKEKLRKPGCKWTVSIALVPKYTEWECVD
jgi:hypothetical protein